MKKTILALLMAVMLATPCFAQDVEPEGMFSIEGTLWRLCHVTVSVPYFYIGCYEWEMGFYQGYYSQTPIAAYTCDKGGIDCQEDPFLSVINLGVVSILWETSLSNNNWTYFLAILQPFGLGLYSRMRLRLGFSGFPTFYEIGIMFKVDDNWTPGIE